ncbi:MAG: hypothetical protein NTZ78_00440 [Candidatus Aureabacteria bacterium]|nr:hypothetical protein [Candidatus Auribacterota bacterium]
MSRLVASLVLFAAFQGAGIAEEIQVPAPDGSTLSLKASDITRDEQGNINARGRVEVAHSSVSIACVGTVTVSVSGGKFSSLEAQGIIEAVSGDKKLWGQHLYYEQPRHLITVSGEPRAQQGGTRYSAEKRILCYLETGVMKFEPKAQIFIEKNPEHGKKKPGKGRFFGLF